MPGPRRSDRTPIFYLAPAVGTTVFVGRDGAEHPPVVAGVGVALVVGTSPALNGAH